MIDILDYIKEKIACSSDFQYDEAIGILDFSVDIKKGTNVSEKDMQELISVFPTEDKVTLTLMNDAEDSKIYKNYRIMENDVQFYSDEELHLKCHIDKAHINNSINIYNYNKFCDYINKKDIVNIMKLFANILQGNSCVCFNILDKNIHFSTSSIEFKGISIEGTNLIDFRHNRIESVKENANFRNGVEFSLVPEDFAFKQQESGNLLFEIFDKIRTLLSIAYIVNESEIVGDKLLLKVIGNRNVTEEIVINDICSNAWIQKIYSCIYVGGNVTDKVIIARNVLCLHCQYESLLNIDEKIFASIHANFSLYQRGNVDKYLQLKNDISDKINETIGKSSELALSIPNGIKNNLLAVFTFLFTVILANIVSDVPLTNIFTRDITRIFEVILVTSFLFLGYTVYEVNYRIMQIKSGFKSIKKNYEDIYQPEEMEEIFNNNQFEKDTIGEIKKKRDIFIVIWIILIVLGFIVIESLSDAPIVENVICGIRKLLENKHS